MTVVCLLDHGADDASRVYDLSRVDDDLPHPKLICRGARQESSVISISLLLLLMLATTVESQSLCHYGKHPSVAAKSCSDIL